MKGWIGLLGLLLIGGCRAPAPAPVVRESPPTVASESPEVLEYLTRKERWPVKVGGDPYAKAIDLTDPVDTNVGQLTGLARPEDMPDRDRGGTERYGIAEKTLWRLEVEIVRYKLSRDDQDLHVVVRDPGGTETMIVEIPDPTFVPKSSPWRDAIRQTRSAFYGRFPVTTKFKNTRTRATITGIGFFDFIHGQSGVADNGIEIHPVLSIEFSPVAPRAAPEG